MKRIYEITGDNGMLEVRSEEGEDTITICIGTVGRTIKGKLAGYAAQNARNVGFKPDKDLEVKNTIKEVDDRPGVLFISSHPTDSSMVVVEIEDVKTAVNYADFNQAILACSLNQKLTNR